MSFLSNYILILKSLHLIAVMSWMAGMLYLPRLFVYHTQTLPGRDDYDRFLTMERRLLKGIMLPAMLLTFLFGILLALATRAWDPAGGVWLHVKIMLVLGMAGLHGYLVKCHRDFSRGENRKSERFYRIINEIPAILMAIIVVLAVTKPF